MKLNVFPDKGYANLFSCSLEFVKEMIPCREVWLTLRVYAGLLKHNLVEPLGMHHQRHLIDCGSVKALEHSVGGDVAELGNLAAHRCRDLLLCAQHEDVGLNASLLKHLHGVLCGFCLQLLGCLQIRHVGEVKAEGVLTHLPAQLAHSLKEGR